MQNSWLLNFFSLQHFKCCSVFLLAWFLTRNLIRFLLLLIHRQANTLWFHGRYPLSSVFLLFEYDVPRGLMFGIYTVSCSLRLLAWELVCVFQLLLKWSSASFFYVTGFPLCMCYVFCNCPRLASILFILLFFPLPIDFRSFYWLVFKVIDSFLSCVQFLLEPIKSILHSILLISGIYFLLELLVFPPLCLQLLIYSYILSTFSIRALNILLIVILILW